MLLYLRVVHCINVACVLDVCLTVQVQLTDGHRLHSYVIIGQGPVSRQKRVAAPSFSLVGRKSATENAAVLCGYEKNALFSVPVLSKTRIAFEIETATVSVLFENTNVRWTFCPNTKYLFEWEWHGVILEMIITLFSVWNLRRKRRHSGSVMCSA